MQEKGLAHLLVRVFIVFLVFACSLPPSYGKDNSLNSYPYPSTESLSGVWDMLSRYHRDHGRIDKTIEMLEEKLAANPGDVEALILLSRVWLTYGYVKARGKQDLVRVYENGKAAAEKAIEIEPENPDAHFFYVANLASLGDAKGLFNSLFMLPEIRRELDTILEIDPDNENALAMQGALFYYLPGILGGDVKISEIYIRQALRIDPHLSSAKLYLAMNLRRQKRYDEAMVELKELVSDKDPTFYPDWYVNRIYALRMISRLNKEISKQASKNNTQDKL